MKTVFTLLSVLVFSFAFSQTWTDSFSWIEGSWVTEDGSTLETWEAFPGNLLGTTFEESSDTDYVLLEELKIHKIGDVIVYTALIVGDQKVTSFKCTQITSKLMVFEKPDHDFPKKISYERVNENELLVLISGDGQEIEWKYFRLNELDE